jgi:Co/Zn/Cd efflux system component
MACCDDSCSTSALQGRQRRVLYWVLAINAGMFIVEASAGWIAHSSALLADSLDMLGDSLVYSFSLFAISRGPRWAARSALLKGGIMALFGLFVLGEVIHKLLWPVVPVAETIGVIGVLALLANLTCLLLLTRHRSDDINMNSVWLCSRNDIIANAGVLTAAAGVALTHQGWPDIVIGLLIATLFLRSAVQVIGRARTQLTQLQETSD